jgi:hypothetical protein
VNDSKNKNPSEKKRKVPGGSLKSRGGFLLRVLVFYLFFFSSLVCFAVLNIKYAIAFPSGSSKELVFLVETTCFMDITIRQKFFFLKDLKSLRDFWRKGLGTKYPCTRFWFFNKKQEPLKEKKRAHFSLAPKARKNHASKNQAYATSLSVRGFGLIRHNPSEKILVSLWKLKCTLA